MGPVVWYVGFIADHSYRAAFSAKEHDPESQMHVQREGMERMVSLDFQISFHAILLGAFWQVPCGHTWPSFVLAGTTSRRRVAKISRSRRGIALSWMLVSKTWRASWRKARVAWGGRQESCISCYQSLFEPCRALKPTGAVSMTEKMIK